MSEQNTTKTSNLSDSTDEIDHMIAKMVIENPSVTDQAIGNSLNIARQTANRRRNSKEVKDLIAKAISIPHDEIRRVSVKALARLESLIDELDPRVALSASLGFLKIAVDLRETLKQEDGYILGNADTTEKKENQQKLKFIELEAEFDRLDTLHKINEANEEEKISEIIRRGLNKKSL